MNYKDNSSERLKGLRGERRKYLEERLSSLAQRVEAIEQELQRLEDSRFYRTCIFGSARIKPDTKEYLDVEVLAEKLAEDGIDILTGGGPGLMEAANKGALKGRQEGKTKSLSFGVTIRLEHEPEPNKHLDVKHHHNKFSSRLDQFMRLSHSFICTPGGIGTLLELYFSWQLIQVKHIAKRPIVLLDKDYWTGLIEWMKDVPLTRGLLGAGEFDYVSIVDTPEEAFKIIADHHKEVRALRKSMSGGEKSEGESEERLMGKGKV